MTGTKSYELTSQRARRKKPIAGILALLCDLAAWLLYPSFWDEDPWVAVGALMLAVLFAGCGAAVALLGMLISAFRARHNNPSGHLGRIALGVSVLSIAVFITTFDRIISSTG